MQARLWLSALVCMLGCTAWAGAEERTAWAILDRAIRAMGGAKTLSGQRALTGTSQGKARINEMDFAVTNEWTVQGIDQLKWSSMITINENEASILLVVNSKGGWISGNNQKANPVQKEHLVGYYLGAVSRKVA